MGLSGPNPYYEGTTTGGPGPGWSDEPGGGGISFSNTGGRTGQTGQGTTPNYASYIGGAVKAYQTRAPENTNDWNDPYAMGQAQMGANDLSRQLAGFGLQDASNMQTRGSLEANFNINNKLSANALAQAMAGNTRGIGFANQGKGFAGENAGLLRQLLGLDRQDLATDYLGTQTDEAELANSMAQQRYQLRNDAVSRGSYTSHGTNVRRGFQNEDERIGQNRIDLNRRRLDTHGDRLDVNGRQIDLDYRKALAGYDKAIADLQDANKYGNNQATLEAQKRVNDYEQQMADLDAQDFLSQINQQGMSEELATQLERYQMGVEENRQNSYNNQQRQYQAGATR